MARCLRRLSTASPRRARSSLFSLLPPRYVRYFALPPPCFHGFTPKGAIFASRAGSPSLTALRVASTAFPRFLSPKGGGVRVRNRVLRRSYGIYALPRSRFRERTPKGACAVNLPWFLFDSPASCPRCLDRLSAVSLPEGRRNSGEFEFACRIPGDRFALPRQRFRFRTPKGAKIVVFGRRHGYELSIIPRCPGPVSGIGPRGARYSISMRRPGDTTLRRAHVSRSTFPSTDPKVWSS